MNSRKSSLVVAAAAAALVGGWSATSQAQTYGPSLAQPTAERPVEEVRPNRPLLTTGALTIAASYIPAVAIAATSDHKGDKYLYVPVAGPWLNLANRRCGPGETARCGSTPLETAALVGTGLAHIAGVAQVVGAYVLPERRTVVGSRGQF